MKITNNLNGNRVRFSDLPECTWYLDDTDTLCCKNSSCDINSNCIFIGNFCADTSFEDPNTLVRPVDVEIIINSYVETKNE